VVTAVITAVLAVLEWCFVVMSGARPSAGGPGPPREGLHRGADLADVPLLAVLADVAAARPDLHPASRYGSGSVQVPAFEGAVS
jgi:hypothetical protein